MHAPSRGRQCFYLKIVDGLTWISQAKNPGAAHGKSGTASLCTFRCGMGSLKLGSCVDLCTEKGIQNERFTTWIHSTATIQGQIWQQYEGSQKVLSSIYVDLPSKDIFQKYWAKTPKLVIVTVE